MIYIVKSDKNNFINGVCNGAPYVAAALGGIIASFLI